MLQAGESRRLLNQMRTPSITFTGVCVGTIRISRKPAAS